MKFRNLVFVFVAIVIFIAWFTKPDYDDFLAYQEDQESPLISAPNIEFEDRFLYTQVTVTYYQAKEANNSNESQQNSVIAIPVSTEKYIGLFGRFWSMD